MDLNIIEALNTIRTATMQPTVGDNSRQQLLSCVDFLDSVIKSMQQQQIDDHRQKAELSQELLQGREEIACLRQKLFLAEQRLRLQVTQLYAAKSEKWKPDERQGKLLFNELEILLEQLKLEQSDSLAGETAAATEPHKRIDRQNHNVKSKTAGRKPLPEKLPRVVTCLDDEADLAKLEAGELAKIGEDVSERLCVKPRMYYVEKVVRSRFVQVSGSTKNVTTAAVPFRVIPKSIASPSLLASIFTAKFCDSLPFYRQVNILAREGIDISRATLARWAIQGSEILKPLQELINEKIMASPVMHMDETTVRILHDSDQAKINGKSWLWCQTASIRPDDPAGQPLRFYRFTCDLHRSKNVAHTLLAGYHGTLVSDAYASYIEPVRVNGITHAGCMAHVRRKYHDVIKTESGNQQAATALGYIKALYAVERKYASASLEQLHAARKEKSKLILGQLLDWINKQKSLALPQGLLGKAIDYTLNCWPRLLVYLDDPRVPIDNAQAENAIRPFAVGRRNWLFCDQVKGAEASALIYSIITTANANAVEPMHYLHFIFKCYEHFGPQAMPWQQLLPTPKIREYAESIGIPYSML